MPGEEPERLPCLLIRLVGMSFAFLCKKLTHPSDEHKRLTIRSKHMLRNISKTVGSAMAVLCLVSTLAMAQAQYPAQPLSSSEKAGKCST